MVIDFENFARENWTTLVPEHPTDVLDWAACVAGDKLVLCYTHDVKVRDALHAGNAHILISSGMVREQI